MTLTKSEREIENKPEFEISKLFRSGDIYIKKIEKLITKKVNGEKMLLEAKNLWIKNQ